MGYGTECSGCGRFSTDPLAYKCSFCGKPLSVKLELPFETRRIQKGCHSMWRYTGFFPYIRETEIVTLGEGWTPLVQFSRNIYFKLESLNPTGSFKDRGSTALLSRVQKPVKKVRGYISEDSSGNAGASVAAYAARAGLKARVYVPENIVGPKFSQIQFYGAVVIKVCGTRRQVAEEAQKPESGKIYVGHILHPLFRDGIRSLAYEIAEQLGWQSPERVYLPVSAGTLFLGVVAGFRHLLESDVIGAMPRIVACQTEKVSPLYHRFRNERYSPPEAITSIADALVSTKPPLLNLMVSELRDIEGDAITVTEEEIRNAFVELAGNGFFVEPSSAVAYAGFKKQHASDRESEKGQTVIVLTGSGLKSTLEPQ